MEAADPATTIGEVLEGVEEEIQITIVVAEEEITEVGASVVDGNKIIIKMRVIAAMVHNTQ